MNGCTGNCNQGRSPCDCRCDYPQCVGGEFGTHCKPQCAKLTRYIPQDVAKCAGNPEHAECKQCLRYLLPVNPNASRQVWMGPWIMDEPCPSRMVGYEFGMLFKPQRPAEPVEPVAWLVTNCIGERDLVFSPPLDNDQVLPLYAATPQRKPLTEEEIDALDLPLSGTATVRDFVRIIERAHGIGAEPVIDGYPLWSGLPPKAP